MAELNFTAAETRLLSAVIRNAATEGQLKVNWETIAKELDYKNANSARNTWNGFRAKKLVPPADGTASTTSPNKRKRGVDEMVATPGSGSIAEKAVKKAKAKEIVNDLGGIKAESASDDI